MGKDILEERLNDGREIAGEFGNRKFQMNKKPEHISKTEMLGARDVITKRLARNRGAMLGSIHNQSQAVYAFHCLETLETQGVSQLRDYLERMAADEKPSRTKRAFLKDDRIRDVLAMARVHAGESHPKLRALGDLLKEQMARKGDCTVIVFTQPRDTIPTIMAVVKDTGATGERFVGQAKRPDGKGLKQARQGEILDRLRRREFNVLVATSVAEEGLDIPDVDPVVFYEPIPSEIRNIQRRGRTGRSAPGKVKVLIAAGSRDEPYLRASVVRESRMRGIVGWLEEGGNIGKRRRRKGKRSGDAPEGQRALKDEY